MSFNRTMFDTVAGKLEGGPYKPKEVSRNEWETRTREFYDERLRKRRTSVVHVLNRPEARIRIMADGAILWIESSLPKLLYGNNLTSLSNPRAALDRLREFAVDHVEGPLPGFEELDYMRVDYCHNFNVGSALPDYIHTLSRIPFLKHRRTTDGYDGVEWWGDNGRRVRVYDKYHEILEQDKKHVPEAKGLLRFEAQIRKKARFLQRRLKNDSLTLSDVLDPALAYCTLVETLNRMCLDFKFVPLDQARTILDRSFPLRKATRLLGVLRRMESQRIEDIKHLAPRSTFYADKADLRRLGLWPPAPGNCELPALELPPLEKLLADAEIAVGMASHV